MLFQQEIVPPTLTIARSATLPTCPITTTTAPTPMPSHHRIIHITPHTPTIPTTAIDDDLFRHNWIDAAICTVYMYRYCCSHDISVSAETCNSRKCCSALDMYMICNARAKRLTRYSCRE